MQASQLLKILMIVGFIISAVAFFFTIIVGASWYSISKSSTAKDEDKQTARTWFIISAAVAVCSGLAAWAADVWRDKLKCTEFNITLDAPTDEQKVFLEQMSCDDAWRLSQCDREKYAHPLTREILQNRRKNCNAEAEKRNQAYFERIHWCEGRKLDYMKDAVNIDNDLCENVVRFVEDTECNMMMGPQIRQQVNNRYNGCKQQQ